MMVLAHRLMGRLKGEPEVASETSRSKSSSKKDQKCEPSVEQEGLQLVVGLLSGCFVAFFGRTEIQVKGERGLFTKSENNLYW